MAKKPEHIESLYESAVKRLQDAGELVIMSLRIARAKGNGERVQIVFEYLVENGLEDKVGPPEPSKNAERAARFRQRGNEKFRLKDDRAAVEFYSKAVAHAPKGSKELALAYGNRSAALFSLKRRAAAFEDAGRALEMIDDDEALKNKLLKRREACLETKRPPQPETELPSLFEKIAHPNSTVPCASSALELKVDKEFGGRSVVANKDILPGELLAIEHPYLKILLEPYYYKRCNECCEPCDASIPCEGCCYAMFCSEACAKEAHRSAHKYECPIMYFLVEMGFTKIELLSLRTVIKAKLDLGSWTALRDVVQSVDDETDLTLKGFVSVGDKTVYDSSRYESVHALITNVSQRSVSDFFMRCVTAATFVFLLDKFSSFYEDAEQNKNEPIFSGGLMLHHYMTSASNMHSIESLVEDDLGTFVDSEHFASGAYPFLSLINHSCAPNVSHVSLGTSIALVALRPIKKGKQVFDNYGQHHATKEIKDRQQYLWNQYKFKCRCEACSEHWPTYTKLLPARLNKLSSKTYQNILDADVHEKLKSGDKKLARSLLKDLYNNVKVLENYAPCLDLADHQETIKQCWALFSNIVYKNFETYCDF